MTLQEEYNKVLNNISTALDVDDPDQSLIAFSAAQASLLYLTRKYFQELQKNFTPANSYSESEGGSLEAFGRDVLGRDPRPATQGEYTLNITGTIGGVVDALTTLRDIDGNIFEVQTSVTLTATTGQISVISLDAGTDYLLGVNDELFFTVPIANVDSLAVVYRVDVDPIDAETEEEYKKQIELTDKLEAQGGSSADFRLWGQDGTGVVGIYPYLTAEPSIIDIYVEANTADGIPTQTILDAVEDVVELNPDTTLENRGRRPMGVFQINYLPVTPSDIDIEITNLTNVYDISAIEDSVTDYLLNIRPHIDGADDPNSRKDLLSLANINTVINNAISEGTQYDNIDLKVNAASVSTYQFTFGDIPILNSVTSV